MLDESGEEVKRTSTDADGAYAVESLSSGLHHLVVTAHHCEPEIITVALHPEDDRPRDVALQNWNEPAANLSAEEIGARRQLTAVTDPTPDPARLTRPDQSASLSERS